MKVFAFLFCVIALAVGEEEIELNAVGCPVDPTIHKVIEHETYCNLFYSCVGGELVELRCPGELVFNAEEQVCDWAIAVDCKGKEINVVAPESEEEEDKEEASPGGNSDPSLAPEICAKEGSDGVLVAHESCNKFYVCEGRVPVALECPDDLVYNYNYGICDWPVNVDCSARPIARSSEEKVEHENIVVVRPSAVEVCAADKKNEVLVAHEACNKFYKCSFGVPVAFSCPDGLLYNIQDNLCDWSHNVQCGQRPIVVELNPEENKNEEVEEEAGSVGHGHSDPSQAAAICAGDESDSVLIAHENCNQFYKCSQGVPLTLDCPLNLLYNAPLEICDWPLNVDCGSRIKSFRRF